MGLRTRPSKEESFIGAQNSFENGHNSSIKKKKKMKNRPVLSKDKYSEGRDLQSMRPWKYECQDFLALF